VAPMEPWERVRVDAETYSEDVHSLINCTSCHLGQSVDDMELAHEGMVESPTEDPLRTCGTCHETITEASVNSLHMTLAGYDTAVYDRSLPEEHPDIENMEQYHCNECHASCGDCHISQPSNAGGGLLEGHTFVREPSMSRNCTACHGSRVKDEYYGAHEGIASDVHFRARMSCVDCHTGDEMHGIGIDANHRYDGPEEPACESCHEDQIGVGSGILQHELHGTDTLSCQGCHSTSYTNCTNCHVERTLDTDIPFFSVEAHELDFALGRNVLRSQDRPYAFVPVRHVPIDIESFSFYDIEMATFDNRPTWAYATPHNIQRNTPQTESCLSCHENDSVFLTADHVVPEELAANASVIVEHAPPLPDGYENVITGQENQPAPAADSDTGGGFWGDDGGDAASDSESSSSDGDFWGGSGESDADADDSSSTDGGFWGGGEEAAPPATEEADSFWGS
jgi:nitrate/TMAO reductase-like tetraheme cytochrome c subunit